MLPKDVGLSEEEAERRLQEFGVNVLPEKPPPSDISIFISQLKNPLVYILVVAGTVTFLLGDIPDTAIILFAVFVNTVLGFVQERRASRSLEALKKLVHPKADVVRDGEVKSIGIENVVPGDVVILNQGDKIPADGKLLEANRFFVTEAVLTGESSPVEKDKDDEVYMGTIVASGRARLQVEVTGSETKMGKIALRIQEPSEETPLKIQIKNLSKQLSILVFGLTGLVFILGFLKGQDLSEIFTTSVALAVSSIPEGLLVGLTVVLAIGMQRILKRKGLVRNLVSAETLGGVTTICVDKTGTLTEGKLKVAGVIGDEESIQMQSLIANDLDDPIVIAAWEWAIRSSGYSKKEAEKVLEKYERLDSIPFSPKERFFISVNRWDDKNNMIFVNGAPEFLVDWSIMDKSQKEKMMSEIKRLTSEGKRVVGLARKKVSLSRKSVTEKDAKTGLHFVGIMAFSDPVRAGVGETFEETRRAGIKTLVITGDYPETAVSVMKELGLEVSAETTIVGQELEKLTPEALSKMLEQGKIKLFARTSPEQKLKIVEALKKQNEVIAMMGDGVNDAPALKKADIGIVVGEASDVAKETADLVLLDSKFETVIEAIEEGRGIYANIKKIILYLMSDAFAEITAVVGSIILSLPLPVTAAQILWINLISDGFPDLALTVDPKSPNIMKSPPRDPKTPIVSRWMKMMIGIVSVTGGLIAFALFIIYLNMTNDAILARSVSFMALGVNSLIFVFSIRTLTDPFWKENPLENKWLNMSVFVGLFFQFLPLATPGLRSFFGIKYPGHLAILIVFLAGGVMFVMIEVLKSIVRKRIEWFQH